MKVYVVSYGFFQYVVYYFIDKCDDVDGVEGLREVYRNESCSMWWSFLIERSDNWVEYECNAVVVECLFLNPCWFEHCGRWGLMMEWIVVSWIIARGDKGGIGLYEECWFGSLLGFSMGMILAVFHSVGMMQLKSFVVSSGYDFEQLYISKICIVSNILNYFLAK